MRPSLPRPAWALLVVATATFWGTPCPCQTPWSPDCSVTEECCEDIARDGEPACDSCYDATGSWQSTGHGGPFETALGSICGIPGDCREWTPLTCDGLFSEGWDEAWIGPPRRPGDPPRQGWINTLDGFFPRSFNVLYADSVDTGGSGDDMHLLQFQLVTPLSRRLFVEIGGPTVVSFNDFTGLATNGDFGDFFVTPRIMLQETRDLSVSTGVAIRFPTGDETVGHHQTSLSPLFNVWKDVGGGWTVRGGFGVDVPVEPVREVDGVVFTNLAVGQALTGPEAAPLGDFQYYLSLNTRTDLGSADGHTFASLTPGVRTNLGHDIFLLGGYEIPVAGPEPFEQRVITQIVFGF